MKIKGRSGLVIEVPESVGTGLVGAGHAELVDDATQAPASEEAAPEEAESDGEAGQEAEAKPKRGAKS
ncbi:hypothetical protein I6B53_03285 [Schaalia sp. 19OD2882]|uniref:hypothetical protein n=1 Tax=Schaalia sp. 19OD2882 TaxID=2794089 RepID=UPI001C1EA6B4|nr:hypothetical protein [Schaalia sp. 19OD2882]QWW20134.1 hypothetical protein I6B53_03285 [Schaalia sp. 19OD2882]